MLSPVCHFSMFNSLFANSFIYKSYTLNAITEILHNQEHLLNSSKKKRNYFTLRDEVWYFMIYWKPLHNMPIHKIIT